MRQRLLEGMGVQAVSRPNVGAKRGAGIQTGKDGRVEQEGLWKSTVCKPWLLFQGLDQASSDPSGTFDGAVEIITNNTPTDDANEYTVDIFSRLNFDIYVPFLACFGEKICSSSHNMQSSVSCLKTYS